MNSSGLGRNLLRDVSRSFYLSLRLLPRRMRAPCSTGYLLARLADTIADCAGLPASTRIRLLRDFRKSLLGSLPFRKLHEALHESLLPSLVHPGERRLVESTEACFRSLASLAPGLAHEVSEVVQIITAGQESDLRHFPGTGPLLALPAAEDLTVYTDRVAGCVGRFWTRVGLACYPRFSSLPAGELSELGTRYGRALQLVNILRDLPEDLEAGRCYLPQVELDRAGWRPNLPWREQTGVLRAVSTTWEAAAAAGLRDGLAYANSLRQPPARLATALPALLGIRTLEQLQRGPERRFEGKLRISRQDLKRALVRTALAAILGRPFRPV